MDVQKIRLVLKDDRQRYGIHPGLLGEVDQPVEVGTWLQANSILRGWARLAPKDVGHLTVHYRVTFDTGQAWDSAVLIDRRHRWKVDFFGQVMDSIEFYTGRSKQPGQMDAKTYEQIIKKRRPKALALASQLLPF